MEFDVYIRGASITAIVFAALLFLLQVAGIRCASLLVMVLFAFIQGPAVLCALVAPFVWRVAQGRPIERRSKVLFTWAVIATAFQVTLAVMEPANHCFR